MRSEKAAEGNKYNKNFANRFCGCSEDYNPHQEKGTMFQCLGLGSVKEGGCGEDWWHPECLVGLPRGWHTKEQERKDKEPKAEPKEGLKEENGHTGTAAAIGAEEEAEIIEEPPLPPGFPTEDDFDGLVCYKCVEANPWFKRYAGTEGFLPPVFCNPPTGEQPSPITPNTAAGSESRKRKSSPDEAEEDTTTKRVKSSSQSPERIPSDLTTIHAAHAEIETFANATRCRYNALSVAATGTFSICLAPNFRDYLCRCP